MPRSRVFPGEALEFAPLRGIQQLRGQNFAIF